MLVLDFGGQYSQLIARRVREARVYSEIVSHRITAAEVRARNPLALILSGGPASVYAEGAPQMNTDVLELGIPTLGICYGMQVMARDLGGNVESNDISEYGKAEAALGESTLFHDLRSDQVVWMSHRDSVTEPPPGARVTASSPSTPIAAFEDASRGLYAVQFHPEVVHTPDGQEILKNFLYEVAGAPPTWTPAAVIEEQVERIRAQVGSERVDLRALGRRRLGRGGAARLQGGRRPADLRVRRPRAHARQRGGAGRRDLRRPLPGAARPRPRRGAVPHPARGRHRSRRRSARSSARSSSASSRRRRASSARRRGSSSRARSTRT